MTSTSANIFPGPRPYEEHQAHLFFGREREVDAMVNATFERMGILSAESGAGKTSLLAAGYIPELRRLRASGKEVPPVLLLREWGGGDADPMKRIVEGVERAVRQLEDGSHRWVQVAEDVNDEELKRWARSIAGCMMDDFESLYPLTNAMTGEPPMQILAGLCEAGRGDGLILILDQFEEFMGSASQRTGDAREAEEVIQAVGRVYHDQKKIHTLVALRTEYCRTLQRHLNLFVPNLHRRIIDLSPLPPESIRDIVEGVARRLDLAANQDEVMEFAHELAIGCGASDEARDRVNVPRDMSVSVLQVQALLRGYHESCTRKGARLSFSPANLRDYVGTFQRDAASRETPSPARSPSQAGRDALRAWVREQLDNAADGAGEEGAQDRGDLVRWVLRPVLPDLSAQGGYKQHLGILQLCLKLGNRLAEGLANGSWLESKVRDWMTTYAGAKEHPSFDLDFTDAPEEISKKFPTERDRADVRKNVSRCLPALYNAIQRLRNNGILKLSGLRADEMCELVHDGLAADVREWSSELAKDPQTILGCPVAVRGEQFQWARLERARKQSGEYQGKEWLGCAVVGATISGIRFEKCNFSGTFFGGGGFEGVTFRECTLNSVLFKDVKLVGTTFSRCKLVAATFLGCGFSGNNSFKDDLPSLGQPEMGGDKERAGLTSIQFEKCSIAPESVISFDQCVLRFARIGKVEFARKGVPGHMSFTECDMMNAWVEDAGTEQVRIDKGCRSIGMLSWELPREGWLPR